MRFITDAALNTGIIRYNQANSGNLVGFSFKEYMTTDEILTTALKNRLQITPWPVSQLQIGKNGVTTGVLVKKMIEIDPTYLMGNTSNPYVYFREGGVVACSLKHYEDFDDKISALNAAILDVLVQLADLNQLTQEG